MINKSEEWKQERHVVLDELLEQFAFNAHKYMDRIIESNVVTNDSYIAQDSTQALPQNVMNIVCSKCVYKPKSGQIEWKGEIEMIKRVIK